MARKIKTETYYTSDLKAVNVDAHTVNKLLQMLKEGDIKSLTQNVTAEGVWFTFHTNYSHGSIFLNHIKEVKK